MDRECTKPFSATAFTEGTTTLYGRWSDFTVIIITTPSSSSSTEQAFFTVEIVFSAKSIVTDDETKAEIKKIVGDEHAVRIEVIREDNGQAMVITKFVGPEVDEGTVNEFVSSIKESDKLKDEILDIKAFDSTRVEEGGGRSSTTVIIVVVVVIVVLIVVFALFFLKRQQQQQAKDVELARLAARSRVVADSLKTEDGSKYKSAFKHSKKTCPEGYKVPRSIKRALMKARGWRRGSPQREGVESECASRVLRGRGFTTEEFTAKDAAAVVAIYTFDFGGGGRDVRQEPAQAAELCVGLEEGGGGGVQEGRKAKGCEGRAVPCDDRSAQAPCCGGDDAVQRDQEKGRPEQVQGG